MKSTLATRIAAGSPYLHAIATYDQSFAMRCANENPNEILGELLAETMSLKLTDPDELGTRLRQIKKRVAYLIASADLSDVWQLSEVTAALTQFADAATESAISALLHDAKGKFTPRDETNPTAACGYVALAMGKHGAFELNYSSDIDLIIFYDPETAPLAGDIEPSQFFVKLTRKLVALLQDITEDGYVFRVDLRLRPDPRATQVAIAIESAATYYENQGQNWERAAMIKARPCAGDIALGLEFLARLRPYIWRKYLDFAAIADVQSMKRQIHAVKGHADIAVQGHNLKLGRGGIREIEFFVQTQQLIAGGRNPELRGLSTVAMLHALANAKWISQEAAIELEGCYNLLRELEHRVQMVDDQQDHCVPSNDENFARYVTFCGYKSTDDFSAALTTTLQTVQKHYQALFEDEDLLSSAQGSLVFTGGEDDPATITTLQAMGFSNASEMSATIRGWHFGRYNATRSKRAQELLTELMPRLLKALADTGDGDSAFIAFDQFMAGLPAGVQLFSMIKANEKLLELLAAILGSAPRLAQQLSRKPRILEAVLDPSFFGPLPSAAEISNTLLQSLTPDIPLEESMDRARVLGRELMFRVGVRILAESVSAEDAGLGFSNLADQLIQTLHAAVLHDLEARHGKVLGGETAVIAMGKLGSREMTASSDLDLILIYDHDPDATQSDGERPLSVAQYYARLTQRLIAALSSPTAEGVLYEVDMRLRPSGAKGPIATHIESFASYQKQEAWTWERMALTRARVISADKKLEAKLNQTIVAALAEKRDTEAINKDVREMRSLMLQEHKPSSPWDIKRSKGGLVDIEFLAQTLQLIANDTTLFHTNTTHALRGLQAAGYLQKSDADKLLEACQLYHRLTQVIRLCLETDYEPTISLQGLNTLIMRAASLPTVDLVLTQLIENQLEVAEIFTKYIGEIKN